MKKSILKVLATTGLLLGSSAYATTCSNMTFTDGGTWKDYYSTDCTVKWNGGTSYHPAIAIQGGDIKFNIHASTSGTDLGSLTNTSVYYDVLQGTCDSSHTIVNGSDAVRGVANTTYCAYFKLTNDTKVMIEATTNVDVTVLENGSTTVIEPNVDPTASDYNYTTQITQSVTFDWKTATNASDSDGSIASATIKKQSSQGKGIASISGDNVTYTPNGEQNGSDSFILTIADDKSATVDVTITIDDIDTSATPKTYNICPNVTNGLEWGNGSDDPSIYSDCTVNHETTANGEQIVEMQLYTESDGNGGGTTVRPMYVAPANYTDFEPDASSSGYVNLGQVDFVSPNTYKTVVKGSCKRAYPKDSHVYTLPFEANTTFCSYFKTDTNILTIEGTTGASEDDAYTSYSVKYYPLVAPVVTSTPTTSAIVGEEYVYIPEATDADGDSLSWSKTTLPTWLTLENGTVVKTFAGSGTAGSDDGDLTSALFNKPRSLVFDSSGNLFVVDAANQKIRKITPQGVVTTFAGSGTRASVDGVGTEASFTNPNGIAIDSNDNLYVAQSYSIRKITPNGTVTTLAGDGTTSGYLDATGAAALFTSSVYDIAVDSSGNVFVADAGNNRIRKITPAGVVTTFAGNNTYESIDGTGTAASFKTPGGLAFDSAGNLFVTDYMANNIRKITPQGVVTTFAEKGGSIDVSFFEVMGIMIDPSDNIFVTDRNNKVTKITKEGVVTVFAGNGTAGSDDGIATSATFNSPKGLAMDSDSNIYVAGYYDHKIRKILNSGNYIIGTPTNDDIGLHDVELSVTDGTNNVAHNFSVKVSTLPTSEDITITLDEDHNKTFSSSDFTYVDADGDSFNSIIITSTPATGILTLNDVDVTSNQEINVSDIANLKFTPVANEYASPYTTFKFKVNDGVSNSTNEYTATINVTSVNDVPSFTSTPVETVNSEDEYNYTVTFDKDIEGSSLTLSGDNKPSWLNLTTIEGNYFNVDNMQKLLDSNTLANPFNITFDKNGIMYIADADGVVKFDINTFTAEYIADSSDDADISEVRDVAVDSKGTVYFSNIADWEDTGGIFKITADGTVSRVNTMIGVWGVYVDQNDTLFITERKTNKIYKMLSDETFEELTYFTHTFEDIMGITSDNDGNLYVVDNQKDEVVKIALDGTVTTLVDTTYLEHPFFITIDSEGYLYVADAGIEVVFKISNDGTSIERIIDLGGDDYLGMKGIAFDPDGNFYISESYTKEIYKIAAGTTAVSGTLSGTPTCSDLGDNEVSLILSDGISNIEQNFTITVQNDGSCNDTTASSELQEKDTGISAPSQTDTTGTVSGDKTTYTQIFTDANFVSKEVRIVVNSTLDKSTVTTANSIDTTVAISSTQVIKSQVNNNGTIENTLNNTGVEAGRINVSVVGADVNITNDKLISTYQKDETTSIEADLNIDGTTVHKVTIGSIVSQTISSHASSEVLIDVDKVTTTAGNATSDTSGYIIKSVVITDTNGESITRFIKVNENDSSDYTVVGNTVTTSTPFAKGNDVNLGTLDNGKMFIMTQTPLENNLVIE